MRVLIDTPSIFPNRKSTDVRYLSDSVPSLAEWRTGLEFARPGLAASWRLARERLSQRLDRALGRGRRRWWHPAAYADDMDLVWSNDSFPLTRTPVLWQNTIVDPEMRRASGVSESEIDREIESKRPLFEKSKRILVATAAERERLQILYPASANRVVDVPFLLPQIASPSVAEVMRKQSASAPIIITFIGNDAIRKRLTLLVEALALVSRQTKLQIVSNLTDGNISLPIGHEVARRLERQSVLNLLRESHLLVVPSAVETYGLVYVEALSQGCVPVGPSWESQREIFAGGRAGVNLPPSANARYLANVLADLIDNPSRRIQLATAGLSRFHQLYSREVVAPKLISLVEDAAR